MNDAPEPDDHLAPIETGRLWLSVPPESHAARVLLFDQRNREHFAPWAPPRPEPLDTIPAWRARLRVDRQKALDGAALLWRLRAIDNHDGPVIGTVSFTRIERGPLERASVGASIDVDHEGRGLAYEAIDAALDFAANALRLRFIEALPRAPEPPQRRHPAPPRLRPLRLRPRLPPRRRTLTRPRTASVRPPPAPPFHQVTVKWLAT